MAAQDKLACLGLVKPAQWSVSAALALALLAFFFSIGGLAGVWWSGSFEMQNGRSSIRHVEYSSTLWDSTVKTSAGGHSEETTENIDDTCAKSDDLDDTQQSNCEKIRAVRAFIFLESFALLPAFACAVAWLTLQARSELGKADGASWLQKPLLVAAVSWNAFALLWALLAVIVAPTLDFGDHKDDIGANGCGFVLTIIAMVLCLLPSAALECLAWWLAYPRATPVEKVTINLPTLVTSKAKVSEGDTPKAVPAADVEAAIVVGREQEA